MDTPRETQPQVLIQPETTRLRRLSLAWGGLAIAIGWAITQSLLPNGVMPLDFSLFFLNGLFVAIYGTMLWTARSPASVWNGFIVFGVLGACHFIWILPASLLVQLAGMRGSVPIENASMYVATGGVLGIAVVALYRSWRVIPWLVTGTCASAVICIWTGGSVYMNWRLHAIGLPCAPLHLGIAGALFIEAIRCIGPSPQVSNICTHCGYDLIGLAVSICPECGEPIQRLEL